MIIVLPSHANREARLVSYRVPLLDVEPMSRALRRIDEILGVSPFLGRVESMT